MRVLVTGDRYYDDPGIVWAILDGLYLQAQDRDDPEFIVTEGQCPKGGADLFAEQWAKKTGGVTHDPHPADWNQYGNAAGPIRNREMLATKPDLVVAFHDNLHDSSGTADMVKIAAKAQIPVYHLGRIGNPRLF